MPTSQSSPYSPRALLSHQFSCESGSRSVMSLCDPMGYTVHGILQARILEWVAFPFSRDLPNPGIEPRSPALQADSLPVEPQGKPKNTRVGSLSLFQWIFPTQKSNRGLLHCRRILYQQNYAGSPQNLLGCFLVEKVMDANGKFKQYNVI